MLKLSRVILICLFFVTSCSEEEQPNSPTKSDLEGYWKLTKIEQSGTAIGFEDYQSPNSSSRGIDNQYYSFNSSGESTEITEYSVSVLITEGQWDVLEDKLITNHFLTGNKKFNIISFNQNEITLANQAALEYNLFFTRIEKDDFPETLMSATINDAAFEARSNQAYLESGGYIQLSGDNVLSDWISIIINNPSALSTGATYPIGDGVISAVYYKGADIFSAYEGQLKIERIRTDYIDATFSFKAKTSSAIEVNVTNGKFKAIVKDNR